MLEAIEREAWFSEANARWEGMLAQGMEKLIAGKRQEIEKIDADLRVAKGKNIGRLKEQREEIVKNTQALRTTHVQLVQEAQTYAQKAANLKSKKQFVEKIPR